MLAIAPSAVNAATDPADSINQLGLDLLRAHSRAGPPGNQLLSPYSIQLALAMAYAGADGATRQEMSRVLHLANDPAQVARGYSALSAALAEVQSRSRASAQEARRQGGDRDVIELNVANRLFTQDGYALRLEFTALLRDEFQAPLQALDFRRAPEPSRLEINAWVAGATRDRIRDLVPAGAIDDTTRVVLANAIYLKAPWDEPFEKRSTEPEPFWITPNSKSPVPTMSQRDRLGHDQRDGFTALALPFAGGDLQFLVLLPDARDGLAALERSLTAKQLAACTTLKKRDVIVHLPRLKLEPPVVQLGETLRSLGMTTAFDQPQGSANFDRMAPRTPDDYLAISEVVHRTWLALDEEGAEAAAATAVVMVTLAASAPVKPPPPPIEVRVDHPLLFAIQHVASGACLFLGRVTDPR